MIYKIKATNEIDELSLELEKVMTESNTKFIESLLQAKEEFLIEMLNKHLKKKDKFLVKIFGIRILRNKVYNLQFSENVFKTGVRIYGKDYTAILKMKEIAL
jgi:hypothetical protein